MNKKWYLSKKLWTAIVTVMAALATFILGVLLDHPDLAEKASALITLVGMTLIMGFGLADFGKEASG